MHFDKQQTPNLDYKRMESSRRSNTGTDGKRDENEGKDPEKHMLAWL